MIRILCQAIAGGCAFAMAACGSSALNRESGFAQPAAVETFTLTVRSDYLGEVDIYALAGSTRFRLGRVATGATTELRVPPTLANRPEIRLQADPVGPDAPFTLPAAPIGSDGNLELTLTSSLQMSTLVW